MKHGMEPWILAGTAVLFASVSAQAATCKKAYSKVLPYNLPVGGDKASVLLHNEVRLGYDCEELLAEAESGLGVKFLKLDLDVFNAQVSAVQNTTATNAYARMSAFGYEIAREDFDLEHVVDLTLRPDTDFDKSGSKIINIGPLPVPVQYGVEGNAAVQIKAGLQDLGFEVAALPAATARAYVQASSTFQIIGASASGELLLIDEELSNKARLEFEDDDRLYLRAEAVGVNKATAMVGQVSVKANFGSGANQKTYDRQIFSWPGVNSNVELYKLSDRYALGSN